MNSHYYQDRSLSYHSEDDSFYEDPRNIVSLNNHQEVLTDPFLDDDFYYDDGEQHVSSPTPSSSKIQHISAALRPNHVATYTQLSNNVSRHNTDHPVFGRALTSNAVDSDSNASHSKPTPHVNDPEHAYRTNRQLLTNSQRSLTARTNSQYDNIEQPGQASEQPRTRNSHGIRLRPVSELPDIYRSMFKFGVFNAVQSSCFEAVMNGDKNMVVSAPTGSGKTVLFELGIIRMLDRSKATGKPAKCIYVAPTKALCSEKFQDWMAKFEPVGYKCCELTGDTVVFGQNAWGDARNASIIVTTCEKWDSLTRNWHEHEQILSQIRLFLVDEVHILNELRGSTLEVVTSRMKRRGSYIRFILVSATVPNIRDVASWIESGLGNTEPAQVFEFGDEFRPCQLTRHVVGVFRKNGTNDFAFARTLDSKLFSVLREYSVGKPILVFCSTRKGVFETADTLMKEFCEGEKKRSSLPWSRPNRISYSFSDKRLNDLASIGIGVHHAGITMDDRKATEHLYLTKTLRVLIATSTLAVGVNLPAHMVVIKGVKTYQNNACKEYSDLDVMQMLGRAGRPQYDKDGIAVILCETDLEQKYKALVSGRTILESSLHTNLAEHLNSEIGLGTITDVESAKSWLRSSFLYQRMQKNPNFYALVPYDSEGTQEQTADVDQVVMDSIFRLKKTQLIDYVENGKNVGALSSTQYGEIMSKYYIRRATMELILAMPEKPSLREILETICSAEEFHDVKLRASEKNLFNKLRQDVDIRYQIKKVEKTADKVFILVQAVLSGISFNNAEYKNLDSQPHMEAFSVFKNIVRVARAALDVAVVKKDGLQIKNGLELVRCLSAKAWEDRAIVFRQIEHIGEKSIKVLAEHGITSLDILRKQNPLRIETLLNRRSPFGLEMLSCLGEFPQYALKIKEVEVHSDGGVNPVQINLAIECSLLEDTTGSNKPKKRSRSFQMTAVLTLTSDNELIDLRRIPTKALKGGKSFQVSVKLGKPSQSVLVLVASETLAGTTFQQVYRPDLPPSEYPTPDTRPLSSVEMDLAGLEDDPDFWNMSMDSINSIEALKTVKSEGKAHPAKVPPPPPPPPPSQLHSEKAVSRTRPDGRYDCNHTCKDKTKCRHMCCRDGLRDPPPVPKKKAQAPATEEVVPKPRSTVQRFHAPSQVVTQKENKILMQLDAIHEGASVADNLQITEGQRLKLEPTQTTKRKRRLSVDPYDISFTDLAGPSGSRPFMDIPGYNSESDDLPETILPMSRVDSKSIHGRVKPKSSTQRKNTRGSHSSTKSPRASKASPRDENQMPRKKRAKYDKSPIQKDSTLFLQSSDSEGSIEITSPQKPSPATRKEESTKDKSPPYSFLMDSRVQSKPPVENERVEDEEFAELDAWLESGSVVIL